MKGVLTPEEMTRYPGMAVAYVLKNEKGDPITSMDGMSQVHAHYLPAVHQSTITGAASDGTVAITLVYHHLDPNRKYYRTNIKERVSPTETEQDHRPNIVRECGKGF
jgi:hypothetical protein